MAVTIFWELIGTGSIDPSSPIDLGNIASVPGETNLVELKTYFTTSGATLQLINCALFLSLYSFPYPNSLESNAFQDMVQLKAWGGLVGQASHTGVLVNMNKQNGYPVGSWLPLNATAGASAYTPLILAKEAIQLQGGGFSNTNGVLPLGAAAYFQLKVRAPVGADSLRRYFSLVLNYDEA